MPSNGLLIFALIIWPALYLLLLWLMRRATVPAPFAVEFLIAFATFGELLLLPLFSPGPLVLLYGGFYVFSAVLSSICIVSLLRRPSPSPFRRAALLLLTLGIAAPWIAFPLLGWQR